MNSQHLSPPPSWLPLRLLCGSALAAVVVLLTQNHDWKSLFALQAPAPGLWMRCGSSLILLFTALLLALSLGLAVGLTARRIGPWAEKLVALLGRALACLPVVFVAWGFISLWIGHWGLPVESLMPAQLPEAQPGPNAALAALLWEFLAPALVLAIPLCGEILHCVVTDAADTVDLDFSLRVRGVPASSRLWRHHLRQLLPLLRVRMQSLCLVAPVYLIIVEDVLRFMGWGGWMAQLIRSGDVEGLAAGILTGGVLCALTSTLFLLLRGKVRTSGGLLPALAWQPWLLWAVGLLALPLPAFSFWPILWFSVLISGSATWLQAWTSIEDQLPSTASQALGASESQFWRLHGLPLLLRMLAAWICTLFAQTLLGIALACTLQPRLVEELSPSLAALYRPLAIASMQDAARTLAEPAAMLQAGASLALAALCLTQVSRIVQPRPS